MKAPDGTTISDLVVSVHRRQKAKELIAATSGQVTAVLAERVPALLVDPEVVLIELHPHSLVIVEEKWNA